MLGVAEETFFTPTTMFWLYNLAYFVFNDLFHGIVLPLFIISIPPRPDTCFDKKSFYIRTTSVLEPRRPRAPESLCFETGSKYFEIRAKNGKIPLQATLLPFEQTLDKGNNEQAIDVQEFSKTIAPFYPVVDPQPELFLPNSESIIPLDPKDIQHMVKKILR